MLNIIWILFIGVCFYLFLWLVVIICSKIFNIVEGYIRHNRQMADKIDIIDPFDRPSQFIEKDEE